MALWQWGLDWAQSIDFDKMRRGRVERGRAMMKKHGFDAMILYESFNIRYLTSSVVGRCPDGSRFCILAGDHEPVLFELGGDVPRVEVSSPWMEGRVRTSVPLKYIGPKHLERWGDQVNDTLASLGAKGGLIGIDSISFKRLKALEMAGIRYADCGAAMAEARMIKTPEEIECVKMSVSLGSAALAIARDMIRKGAVREIDLQLAMTNFLMPKGADGLAVIASGEHTNPYWRIKMKDKLIEEGDLVIIDRIHEIFGYPCDFVRTFLAGDVKATAEQKELHKMCYEEMYASIERVGPGVSTAEVAAPMHEKSDYSEVSFKFGHGIGMQVHEIPYMTFMSEDDPAVLEPNMTLAIETYAGYPGGKQGVRLEENLVVTQTGYEIISRCPFDDRLM